MAGWGLGRIVKKYLARAFGDNKAEKGLKTRAFEGAVPCGDGDVGRRGLGGYRVCLEQRLRPHSLTLAGCHTCSVPKLLHLNPVFGSLPRLTLGVRGKSVAAVWTATTTQVRQISTCVVAV
jgi:hypothetical protein